MEYNYSGRSSRGDQFKWYAPKDLADYKVICHQKSIVIRLSGPKIATLTYTMFISSPMVPTTDEIINTRYP